MFSKKFKVRIIHALKGQYKIQWCHYRIFPTWHTLTQWFDFDSSFTGYISVMLPPDEAEQLASHMVSIDSITEWYKKYEIEEKKYLEYRARIEQNRVPFETKTIVSK